MVLAEHPKHRLDGTPSKKAQRNFTDPRATDDDLDGFVSLGKRPGTRAYAIRLRLARAGLGSRYRLPKQVVEPVTGQDKAALGSHDF
ncbi:hypothetical protein [Nannocystis pusilla]|uniref:Integrase n=1 Tax=Nannocystis pusilla TaxID=889268 RepID=A0ABS7U162_9BACT|nr:hypothetical protein [Nannocystis pusilla]MBZ5714252.1 hypothetical protein [Nannocystis pusilla]